MSAEPLYLDHAATTPVLPQARAAMIEGMRLWANPSSPHRAGRAARAALEDARARLAAALGWDGEVVFTSGATEALAIAIGRADVERIIVSPTEHEAVLRAACDGAARLTVDSTGLVDAASLHAALKWTSGRPLVAIQQVNNETGVIQPLDELAPAIRAAGGILVADCAQGAGKIALPNADLIAIAGHKFGAPVGIGALLVRDFALLRPSGGQERGYRPGTENMPAAQALAAAAEAGAGWLEQARELRARLDAHVLAAGGEVIAEQTERIPSIGAYRIPGLSSAAALIRFDAMGIAISAGSACSSGSLRVSHVMEAMAYQFPSEVIRVSIGRETTSFDIDRFLSAWDQLSKASQAA